MTTPSVAVLPSSDTNVDVPGARSGWSATKRNEPAGIAANRKVPSAADVTESRRVLACWLHSEGPVYDTRARATGAPRSSTTWPATGAPAERISFTSASDVTRIHWNVRAIPSAHAASWYVPGITPENTAVLPSTVAWRSSTPRSSTCPPWTALPSLLVTVTVKVAAG